jgi:hypothetical protein
MEFIETPTFTRIITELLSDNDYRGLQCELSANPDAGDLIPGGGGIRKYRFALSGTGKRGGARLIYYWLRSGDTIFMLLAYPKGKKESLTRDELAVLRALAKELEHEAQRRR